LRFQVSSSDSEDPLLTLGISYPEMRQESEKLARDKMFVLNESLTVTELLHAWKEGDRSALDQLVPLVYANLRGMAASHLRRESASPTLDPTALVHEAYLRLVGDTDPEFQNRAHFLGVASAGDAPDSGGSRPLPKRE